jgi:hypothetical protein
LTRRPVLESVILAIERNEWKGRGKPPGGFAIYRVKRDGQPAKLIMVPRGRKA